MQILKTPLYVIEVAQKQLKEFFHQRPGKILPGKSAYPENVGASLRNAAATKIGWKCTHVSIGRIGKAAPGGCVKQAWIPDI